MRPAPVLLLGMHRSGTSCLAALLRAAGARISGESLRNWDNPLGHHEAMGLVRLNEDVLATSGGHWLAPPPRVQWTPAQAAERDRLLAVPGATLWKDPRTLLVLPFWQASALPWRAIGIVRHPLAVAHSLLAWRGMPMDEGLRLWLAHNQPLAESGAPVVCFDRPKAEFIRDVAAIAETLDLDPRGIGTAYVDELVHHTAAGPTADPALLAECEALYDRVRSAPWPPHVPRSGASGPPGTAAILAAPNEPPDGCSGASGPPGTAAILAAPATRASHEATSELATAPHPPSFPWPAVQACLAALQQGGDALTPARAALAGAPDPAAVLAPIAAAALKRQPALVLDLLDGLPPALAGLLRGKALLALGRPAEAAEALQAACDAPLPLHEARHILPVARWEAGQPEAADAALAALLPHALYPFRLHARRAEWAWTRGDSAAALTHLEAALAAAPRWRQGRLLHRRAAWRQALGDEVGAREDRRLAAERDPGYRPLVAQPIEPRSG